MVDMSDNLLKAISNMNKMGGSVASRKPVHTVPYNNGWANKQGGELLSKHHTKSAAQDKGRSIAKAAHTEHVVHNTNGQIGTKNSYGRDTNPPKDKNR